MLIEVKKDEIRDNFKIHDAVVIEDREYSGCIEAGGVLDIKPDSIVIYNSDGVEMEFEHRFITHIYKQIEG